jgi:pimeloyl-ACP methyl ester carboxylesterase
VNRHVALCLVFATGLSLEVLAVPQAPIRDSPRPRYAAGPPPYAAIEVAFQNAIDNVLLAGTLTIPPRALNAPAVLLSQGLGFEPFDRDYTLPSAPALKSFLAIADALSRNGIVVLRVDDRGAGRSSGQKQLSSVQQLADDLVAGVAFLKARPEVDPKRIGIIGHSFSGLTAPIAAVRSNDVAFVITLAALFTDVRVNLERLPPGLRAATTATWTALVQSSPTLSPSELEGRLRDAFTSATANVSDQERAPVQGAMAAIVTQWVKWAPLRRSQGLTDPGETLRALTKPVLAIHGARDRDLDAATNLGPLVRYLGEAANADFTVATIPDIDHWMWVCTQPSEPGKPCAEMQFSPKVLDLITNWIERH